jgi:hypothetical protein
VYITLGTLLDIWTIVAWVFFPPETTWGKFWLVGFCVTGLALLIIGLLLGQIGRAAREAELPPGEVTPAVTQVEQQAAANPPVVATENTPKQPPLTAPPPPETLAHGPPLPRP